MQHEFIIENGRIIDPTNNLDQVCSLYVKEGRVCQVGGDMTALSDVENRFDASGCIVTPGLIDGHIHGYQYSTPLGVDVDRYCLGRGVVTAVDAGSAGRVCQIQSW